jgi:hypothetical protein
MPSLLTVNRSHVHNALLFLKCENLLYTNIEISEENLSLLPEHGVLEEIMAVVQHSEDVDALESERAGSLQDEEDESNSECYS